MCALYIGTLRHLTYVIVGAEKLPEPLASTFKEQFGVALMEGYGARRWRRPVPTLGAGKTGLRRLRELALEHARTSGERLMRQVRLKPGSSRTLRRVDDRSVRLQADDRGRLKPVTTSACDRLHPRTWLPGHDRHRRLSR
jgi:hypothetical protein